MTLDPDQVTIVRLLTWTAAGAALGGILRHGVTLLVSRSAPGVFPLGTLAVNVSGAFLLGTVAALAGGVPAPSTDGWAFVALGMLGSYTTVSSLSLQTLDLVRLRRGWIAALYVLLSAGLGVAAAALGWAAGVAMRGGT